MKIRESIVQIYKKEIKNTLKNNFLTKEELYFHLSKRTNEAPYLNEFMKAFEELEYGDELISKNEGSKVVNGLLEIKYQVK